jgi:DNA transformation protein and related proteins
MDAFTELCIEMLSPLGRVRVRRMFGGQGLYVDDLFMAIVDDGQLFLKTDEVTRERFDAAGCLPFTFPNKDGEAVVTSYRRPPEEALESPPLMLPWARLALEAALRAANAKARKSPAAAKKRTARSAPGKSAGVEKRVTPSTTEKAAAKKAAAKKTTARRS